MNGTINIFKPIGMTSHDVVSTLRKKFKIKKIGHAGTLDPNASGVLILCIGKGTRISEYLLDLGKEYIGELTLGIQTDTQDKDGKIINYSDKIISEKDIYEAFENYTGWIEQIPPMYSALKHKGKKLYELAREGKFIEREPRKAHIQELEILNIVDNKKILFRVKCSKGTYIRTLCNDIGVSLGTYGYMSYLIRTQVGNFNIADSYSIDYIKKLDMENSNSVVCPIDKSLNFMDFILVEDKYFNNIANGIIVPIDKNYKYINKNTIFRVFCKNTFIGLGKIINKNGELYMKMDKVLI